MLDPVEFGKAMAAIVNEATAPLVKRIEELEARPVEIDVSDVVKELLSADGIKQLVGLEVDAFLTENPPPPGKDGKSVTLDDVSLFLDAAIAKHVLELERRASDTIARAIDKIPAPKDGRDGVDLTEVGLEFDGERTGTVKGRTGEVSKRLPIPLWRGYWSEGVVAERGDILTHYGTAYIAVVDNPKCEPGVGKYDHECKVLTRKGRDGKDGRNSIDRTKPVNLKKKPDDE